MERKTFLDERESSLSFAGFVVDIDIVNRKWLAVNELIVSVNKMKSKG